MKIKIAIYSIPTTNKSLFFLYKICLLLLIFQSLNVWFLWGDFYKVIIPFVFVLVSSLNRIANKELYAEANELSNVLITFCLLAIVLINGVRNAGFLSIAKKIVLLFAFYDILTLNKEAKQYLMTFFTRVMGIITLLSLFGWILFLLDVPLPYYYLDDPVYHYTFQNYYLFLYSYHLLFPRFHSVFLEPGHFAMIAVPIIYVNRFNLKNKWVLVLLLGILFSTSIAGYVTLFISMFFLFGKKKIIVLSLIIGSVLLYGANYFAHSHEDNSESAIYSLIFRRLQVNDGDLVANDRFSEDLENYYSNTFKKSSQCLLGLAGNTRYMQWEGGNAGYKLYIIENGYIGLFISFLIYYLLMMNCCEDEGEKKFKYGYFILFMAFFAQASYPFWFGIFFIYLSGLSYLDITDQ